jgi:hypothetical protein
VRRYSRGKDIEFAFCAQFDQIDRPLASHGGVYRNRDLRQKSEKHNEEPPDNNFELLADFSKPVGLQKFIPGIASAGRFGIRRIALRGRRFLLG